MLPTPAVVVVIGGGITETHSGLPTWRGRWSSWIGDFGLKVHMWANVGVGQVGIRVRDEGRIGNRKWQGVFCASFRTIRLPQQGLIQLILLPDEFGIIDVPESLGTLAAGIVQSWRVTRGWGGVILYRNIMGFPEAKALHVKGRNGISALRPWGETSDFMLFLRGGNACLMSREWEFGSITSWRRASVLQSKIQKLVTSANSELIQFRDLGGNGKEHCRLIRSIPFGGILFVSLRGPPDRLCSGIGWDWATELLDAGLLHFRFLLTSQLNYSLLDFHVLANGCRKLENLN